MMTSYDVEFDAEAVKQNLTRIGNQIFKLLPMREENQDWEKPLQTILVELIGMSKLFPESVDLLSLISKLKALEDYTDENEENFMIFRRTIFECCNLIDKVKEQCL